MNPRDLVRPLEPAWEGTLSRVLAGLPSKDSVPGGMSDVARLGPKVAELSAAYNAGRAEGARTKLPLSARVAFSFPRDVPKGAAAVRELVASGALRLARPEERPLRVLDLGAGLGAMTWGLARALAAGRRGAGPGAEPGAIEALLVDEDAEALRTAQAIARAAEGSATGAAPLTIRTRAARLDGLPRDLGAADVVFLGQVLSEIDPNADAAARATAHTELVRRILRDFVAADGALVIVEPALRERTRHLHLVRDQLLAADPGITVFAPCLHAAACPMLAQPGDWCHDDLSVDLPPWVVPVARAAGLRWQGLTFSYLVLRRDGRRMDVLKDPSEPTRLRFRTVSELFKTKGKVELWACTEHGERRRLRLLDRDRERGEAGFDEVGRGDIVRLRSADQTEPVDERGRVAAKVEIDVGTFGG